MRDLTILSLDYVFLFMNFTKPKYVVDEMFLILQQQRNVSEVGCPLSGWWVVQSTTMCGLCQHTECTRNMLIFSHPEQQGSKAGVNKTVGKYC